MYIVDAVRWLGNGDSSRLRILWGSFSFRQAVKGSVMPFHFPLIKERSFLPLVIVLEQPRFIRGSSL